MFRSLTSKISEAAQAFGKKAENAAPISLVDPTRFPYGPFKFKTKVTKGSRYIILASSDLKTWVPLSSEISTGESFEFVDPEAPKFSCRFYRIMAGEVASTNILGYASRTLVPGFSMIANPLRGQNHRVSEIFAGWPDGASLSRFDTVSMRLAENFVKNGAWTNPNDRLAPGEGAIFYNPTTDYKTFSFVGELNQGSLSLPIPAGFSIRSSLTPQPGALVDDLGFPISDGDVVHIFDPDGQKYVLYPFADGKWTSGQPLLGVCESFWIAKDKPANWIRHLAL